MKAPDNLNRRKGVGFFFVGNDHMACCIGFGRMHPWHVQETGQPGR